MKNLINTTFTILIMSLFSASASGDTLTVDKTVELTTKIEQYMTTIGQAEMDGSATVFTHFLIKEEGDIYTVDFMVAENGEITVLTKEIEDEYYRVDLFNAEHVEKYSVAIPTIVE